MLQANNSQSYTVRPFQALHLSVWVLMQQHWEFHEFFVVNRFLIIVPHRNSSQHIRVKTPTSSNFSCCSPPLRFEHLACQSRFSLSWSHSSSSLRENNKEPCPGTVTKRGKSGDKQTTQCEWLQKLLWKAKFHLRLCRPPNPRSNYCTTWSSHCC